MALGDHYHCRTVDLGSAPVLPGVHGRDLRFVPIAVLSALLAPALFFPNGSLDVSLSNNRLMAGIFAILVAWRTKNVLLTILSGMACLLILQVFIALFQRVGLAARSAT
jgi:branched-subunit amino acid transport protein